MRQEFTWVESPGTSKHVDLLVNSTQFGDGYSQDAPAGLHDQREVWTYQATEIDDEVADDIETFLRDGIGWKRFDWKPPRKTVALVFKCTAFSRTLSSAHGVCSISATFEQVWEA